MQGFVALFVAGLVVGMAWLFLGIGFFGLKGAWGDSVKKDWVSAAGGAFFGVLIGGFMLCGLVLGAAGYLRDRNDKSCKARHPNEPWLWRADWHRGRLGNKLDSFSWSYLLYGGCLSLAFAALLLVVVIPHWREWGGWEWVSNFGQACFFSVFIGAIVWGAFPSALRRWRFGAAQLILNQSGAPSLSRLSALLLIPNPTHASMGFVVHLAKVERVVIEGAESNEVVERELSRQTVKVELPSRPEPGRELQIPIAISLPSEAESTTSFANDQAGRCWKLLAEGTGGWLKFRAEFEVPVFYHDAKPSASEESTA